MRILALALLFAAALQPSAGAAPNVVADIAPVHSLVARVMEGVGGPSLLVEPGRSPHGYALRPSQARDLEGADVVFWVGAPYEPWLARALPRLAPRALAVPLMEAEGVRQLARREGAAFEAHDHDGGHGDGAHDDGGHDDHGGADPHVWLDPLNAMAMTAAIAAALAEADPANAETYRTNAAAVRGELRTLTQEVRARLSGVEGRFVVFHDAFHHFEARFGVEAAGAVSDTDAVEPGAARLSAVREVVGAADCVFTEPQMPPRRLEAITRGTGVRVGTLDPLGVDHAPGPDLYAAVIRDLADDLAACLGE